ncbi:hypothetical protein [Streptomyces albireticuli]|uniref:Uncharacterized protein n=1 Tax=Streptomyces albireticuli TaxID=1940 RepID=A0A2A2D1X7_9ACTN|nr:hypothetical protein [Streptomyces albireticuli]MCD9195280.1 hypothetical protein [Streptomyces albireticuli]PAU45534.1 hypothetical protein CK936_28885 [Streptomyces albireticuli]
MTWRARPGPAGTPADRIAARHGRLLLHQELPRVRESALAWRNGLGALLAGLIGFGLLKGRTDVGALAAPYGAVVGGLLLCALLCAVGGAVLLLRAAHGRPAASELPGPAPGTLPAGPVTADHTEALHAARALTRGVLATLGCAAVLTAAVALTWYGPAKDGPRIAVTTPTGSPCGEPLRTADGRLALRTDAGEVTVDLSTAVTLRAVASCAALPGSS